MFHHFPLLARGACSHLNILIFFDPYFNFLDPRFRFLSEPPRILRGLSIPIKILRTLHARTEEPQTLRGLSIPLKILRMLHARASGGAAITAKVVDSEQNSQDAPRKSVRTRRATNRRWSLRK